MIHFEFRNFEPNSVEAVRSAAAAAAKLIFADGIFPPTKSDPVYVDRVDEGSALLVANSANQIIQVRCSHHLTWEFIYQYSHELGHLATRADVRFFKAGSHPWIEEALCGACSVFVTEQIVKAPCFTDEEVAACTKFIQSNYSGSGVDASWLSQNVVALKRATEASPLTRRLGGWIADRFPAGEFLSDNRVLKDVPLIPDLEKYLNRWSVECAHPENVADALLGLVSNCLR